MAKSVAEQLQELLIANGLQHLVGKPDGKFGSKGYASGAAMMERIATVLGGQHKLDALPGYDAALKDIANTKDYSVDQSTLDFFKSAIAAAEKEKGAGCVGAKFSVVAAEIKAAEVVAAGDAKEITKEVQKLLAQDLMGKDAYKGKIDGDAGRGTDRSAAALVKRFETAGVVVPDDVKQDLTGKGTDNNDRRYTKETFEFLNGDAGIKALITAEAAAAAKAKADLAAVDDRAKALQKHAHEHGEDISFIRGGKRIEAPEAIDGKLGKESLCAINNMLDAAVKAAEQDPKFIPGGADAKADWLAKLKAAKADVNNGGAIAEDTVTTVAAFRKHYDAQIKAFGEGLAKADADLKVDKDVSFAATAAAVARREQVIPDANTGRLQELARRLTLDGENKSVTSVVVDGKMDRESLVALRQAYLLREEQFKKLDGFDAKKFEAALKHGEITPDVAAAFTTVAGQKLDPVTKEQLASVTAANEKRFGIGGLETDVPKISMKTRSGNDFASVRLHQTLLGFTGKGVDGDFGPKTSAKTYAAELGMKLSGKEVGMSPDRVADEKTRDGLTRNDCGIDVTKIGEREIDRQATARLNRREAERARAVTRDTRRVIKREPCDDEIRWEGGKPVYGDSCGTKRKTGGFLRGGDDRRERDWCPFKPGIQRDPWDCDRGCCFVGETMVVMADGTEKAIQDVQIGEVVRGTNGNNTVTGIETPFLGYRELFSINGSEAFVTAEHPFLTTDGWKSIDPQATIDEGHAIIVTKLTEGDTIIMLDGEVVVESIVAHTMADAEELNNVVAVNGQTMIAPAGWSDIVVYNLLLDGDHTYYADRFTVHNKGDGPGDCCFIAETQITMADGSKKQIADVQVGDEVRGTTGIINTVTGIETPALGYRDLFSINDSEAFVTAEHPFLTTRGWRSIDPVATQRENPNLLVNTLQVGDVLITANGEVVIKSIVAHNMAEETTTGSVQVSGGADVTYSKGWSDLTVYNLLLDGDHSYYADDYAVHNKGGPGCCFIGETMIEMADGSEKAIEDVRVGDLVVGQTGINTVVGIETPPLGYRDLFSINGGEAFVTAEHPFMTTRGWRSIDPKATYRENPNLIVYALQVGDVLITANGELVIESIVAHNMAEATTGSVQVSGGADVTYSKGWSDLTVYNLLLDGDHTYFADKYLVHNKDCFVAETPILMADGTYKPVIELKAGDCVRGQTGINTVLSVPVVPLGDRDLYAINGEDGFVTGGHPFLTQDGWKAIDPSQSPQEKHGVIPAKLEVGDTLYLPDGEVTVQSIQIMMSGAEVIEGQVTADGSPVTVGSQVLVYNPMLDGDHTYYAKDYLVHNKGCFAEDTPILMADGSFKAVGELQAGDQVIGQAGINTVLSVPTIPLGNRELFAINDSEAFVTGGHPFMTLDGWKAIDPSQSPQEKHGVIPAQLEVGDVLLTPEGEVVVQSIVAKVNGAEMVEGQMAANGLPVTLGSQIVVYNPMLDGDHTYYANEYLVHNKGGPGCCFIAETLVTMADGSKKPIIHVQIGDEVRGTTGINRVTGIETPELGYRDLFSINGGEAFVTAEHPFLTTRGWRSIDPEATFAENPNLIVNALQVGDVLITANGEMVIESIVAHNMAEEATSGSVQVAGGADVTFTKGWSDIVVYNLLLDGDHTYYADDYAVHNKGCFVEDTPILLADGSYKPVIELNAGDQVMGQTGINTVLSVPVVPLGNRDLYAINGSEGFVTGGHPFMTQDGWKAIDPSQSPQEKHGVIPGKLEVGDTLYLPDGEVIVQSIQIRVNGAEVIEGQLTADGSPVTVGSQILVYNPMLDGDHTYYAKDYLVHNKGGCFVEDTPILMEDGSFKPVIELQAGDRVLGQTGINTVLSVPVVPLGDRDLYAINEGDAFVTGGHPFMTQDGWKAIDPSQSPQEKHGVIPGKLEVGDTLYLPQGEVIVRSIQIRVNGAEVIEGQLTADGSPVTVGSQILVYNPMLDGDHTYYANEYLVHNKGGGPGCCFIAETLVTMADGSKKQIADVRIGDEIVGTTGINTVTGIETPALGYRDLFSINGSDAFVTAEHPFLTTRGWRSIDPAAALRENPNLIVNALQVGDVLITENGEMVITSIEAHSVAEATTGSVQVSGGSDVTYSQGWSDLTVYNLMLDGDHTYYADGFAVHNKSCFTGDTAILMADGSHKAVEELVAGDQVVGQTGINTVQSVPVTPLGDRDLYAINDSDGFVTGGHPFMTQNGWKAIDPSQSPQEKHGVIPGKLEVGDTLYLPEGEIVVQTIQLTMSGAEVIEGQLTADGSPVTVGSQIMVYNPMLDGDHTYYAKDYLVHNKG